LAAAAHGVIIDAVSPDLPNLAIVVGDHDAAAAFRGRHPDSLLA